MFRPLKKNILVKPLEKNEGEVLMTGKRVRGIRSGDIVTFDKSKAKETMLGKNKYLVINQDELL